MGNTICEVSNDSPSWGLINLFAWKLVPERWGGGVKYIQRFKDAWVRHNRLHIRAAAGRNRLPQEMLAGVCWIEVGGDPEFIDRMAFEVRTFDWSGPPVVDEHLTLTRHPAMTSFGPVSMQLRTAAQTLGMAPSTMSASQFRSLAHCLQRDVFNIDLVARHLHQLAKRDGFQYPFSMDQIRIIGARYNRGSGLSLDQIKQNTSYGNFIATHWPRFTRLVQ
ncbi:hypothetical protein [Burkholderia ambifaria]|jgi:hypothetical protein|uniref:hypothetical protein n=1 Tax=Burkholderia ambifaria TaxID=152480 RepID=UPI001B95141A|nr:hypothetical protein [Burkholderia ambifaria]MBR8224823.1 hypothetical protein [Burkholderia ambifaria]